ncbi:type I secretion system permease/ATPase [Thiomicrospira sp. WB1]|uniref:type I secretion system permease/ATPase n=1 Tax=Thiomicrospira sp. WB1 TaxID=1685380 RepID=UPI0007477486|nr:type I secretion system permease/ATPase [Thiomicrospira sp. WB1]KUJ72447.1 peptidase [Thiomicrospira sp. WB1]
MQTKNDDLTEIQRALQQVKRSFINVGVFSFFINILMLVPPIYMLQIYDRVLTSRSEETLLMLTLIVVWLFITMGLLEFVRSRMLIRIGNKLDNSLNEDLFSSMFKRSVNEPGQVNAQPLNDMTSLRQFMTGNGLFAFFDSPWLPIYILILFLFHPYFGFFGIFAAIVLFTLAYLNERTSKKLLEEANQENMQSTNYASASVKNAEVVAAMGMEDNLKNKWFEKHLSFLSKQSQASDRASILTNLSKNLRLMFQSLILGLGAWLAIYNEITPGMMIAGSIILGRALAPLDLLIGSWKGFSSARTAYRRLNEMFAKYPSQDDSMPLPDPEGRLSCENIMVTPPGGRAPVVRGVSFELEKGEMLAIIGPSAAGKSSIVRAVLGVWPLLAGKVRLDGADIHSWDKLHLGRHVGYLPQDIELFAGTIAENISRFGELDPDRVVASAKMAGVHELILRLPQGYDTELASGTSGLSGGQRQRIGLARALYGKPKLVVLDEPNSNLDDQGEQALADALKALKEQGVTVVIISHKKPILKLVDKLLLVVDGQPKAFGARDEVLTALQNGQLSLSNQR